MLLWKVVIPVILLSGLVFVPLEASPADPPDPTAFATAGGGAQGAPGPGAEVAFLFEAAARDPLLDTSIHVGDDPSFELRERPVNMFVEIEWECLGLCPMHIVLRDSMGQPVQHLEGASPQSVYVAAPAPGTWTVDLSTMHAGARYEGTVRFTTAIDDEP